MTRRSPSSAGPDRKNIGIGIVGAGRMGAHRARLAAEHAGVNYLRVADISLDVAAPGDVGPGQTNSVSTRSTQCVD